MNNTFNINPLQFKAIQFKKNSLLEIDEVASQEHLFHIQYTCKYKSEIIKGEKKLYAFPLHLEELALGYVMLDCLNLENVTYTSKFEFDDHNISLHLQAVDCPPPHAPTSEDSLSVHEVLAFMQDFINIEGHWDGTGCFHRAAFLNPLTKELHFVEDIGRHNCIDRLAGYAMIQGISLTCCFLLISARITASLYHKARRAGFQTLISRSAITSASYEAAQKDNITLAGFARTEQERITLYANAKNTITL